MEENKESLAPQSTSKNNRNKNSNNPNKPNKRVFNDNYSMKKRQPPKFYQRENDIYVTNKSNFKAQLNQCEKLLNSEVGEVYLHCIGNAISRGINLGLCLERNFNGVCGIETNTSTIELIDDFHPLRDDDDFAVQKRVNSCLHIRVFRHSKLAAKPTSLDEPGSSSGVQHQP